MDKTNTAKETAMATANLYEDNAGGLTLEYRGKIYRHLELLTDESTLRSLARILAEEGELDAFRFAETWPLEDGEEDDLVATCTETGEVEIVGRPGVAARRLIGFGEVS
jgi:hypothetical protein